ncbi:hypothetical protein OF829_17770 [Sphingomonas sp. LB-2]|uniref:hypothetical protein n=1 Tax=Sphingomonas caeni TaxID=2984949 RepID=UPI00223225B6|nr:hypothetical protein [Sphingomonas caeni]MCW3849091.1 hypothetical protein [Sphingomonas caeni]
MKHEIRRILVVQGGWTLAYVLAMTAAVYVAIGYPQLGNWRSAIMLLPLLPAFGILRFTIAQFRRGDEMVRKNQLIAVAWAFGITQFLMVSWCLLEVVGWPRLPMWTVFTAVQAIWITCIWTQVLRYR